MWVPPSHSRVVSCIPSIGSSSTAEVNRGRKKRRCEFTTAKKKLRENSRMDFKVIIYFSYGYEKILVRKGDLERDLHSREAPNKATSSDLEKSASAALTNLEVANKR